MVFARSAINLARPAGSLFTQRVASRTATSQIGGVRTLTASSSRQGKVLLCLYDVSILTIHQPMYSFKQITDNTSSLRARSTPNRSPASSAPQRTSSESASGSRTKDTLSSQPPTRRARAVSSRRRWLTPRSSSPLRKFQHSSCHRPWMASMPGGVSSALHAIEAFNARNLSIPLISINILTTEPASTPVTSPPTA
jgi:hypothetical protein